MAGMFYTLQEVVEKLAKSEAEIKALVKEGKLREFRDGAKQLYKIEDVDAIASSSHPGAGLNDSLEISIDETGEVSLAPEELDALMGTGDKNLDTKFKLDETGELMADESLDETPKAGTKASSGSEILLSPAETASNPRLDTGADISLESSQQGAEVTNGDTKITSGEDTINVLSDSDTGYTISEDTAGDTKMIDKKPKSLDQKGGADDAIARLDEDINLEGAGSGSGLLDLSLQADDTSLGAVLDDIYPETPTAGIDQTPMPQAPELQEESSAEDDQIFQPQPEAQVDVPQEIMAQPALVPAGAGVAVYEVPPDTSSNIFGGILFIPLIILIYSSIVIISGFKPVANMMIVSSVAPIIWYVAAGLAFATIIGVLIASTAGQPKKPKAPKAAKAPKVKKAKPAKEKKGKK